MSDFARLIMTADTVGLKSGEDALDDITRASGKAEDAVGGVEKSTKKAGDSAERMAKATRLATKALAALGVASVGAVANLTFRGAVREAEQLQRNMLRTNAIISATGGVAGRTVKQLHDQARQLALTTLASTEGVMKAQQTLLTFRNIRSEVFDEAIKGALDLASAMGTDLNSATLQIAKALEDPITGMTALTRSGTVFTEAQKEMVKGMIEAGDTMSAQKFILGELAAQYGGVAAKEAEGLAGAQDTLNQRQQEWLLRLDETLGLTRTATAANNAMARAVLFLTDHMGPAVDLITAAAITVTGAYIPAMYRAVTATGAWVASLVTLKGALIGTGIGAFVVALGGILNGFRNSRDAAAAFAATIGDLKAVQEGLNSATDTYYKNMTRANLEAMQMQAQRAVDGVNSALSAARAELEAASFFTNFFGANLYETDRMTKAKAQIAALSAQLVEAEARLSAADNATENFNRRFGETGAGADVVAAAIRAVGDATYAAVPGFAELHDKYGNLAGMAERLLQAQNALAVSDFSTGLPGIVGDVDALAKAMGGADDRAKRMVETLGQISRGAKLDVQARQLAEMAAQMAFAANGAENLTGEARKVYDGLIAAALQAATLAAETARAAGAAGGLADRIARLAGEFGPAIDAANRLATALGNVLSRLGGIAKGLAGLSPIGAAVSNSISGLGGVFKSIATDGVRAAAGGFAQVGQNLLEMWGVAIKTGATVKDLEKHLATKFPAAAKTGGGAAKGLTEELSDAQKAALQLQQSLGQQMVTAIDSVAGAFGDFLTGGIRNFKDFADTILDSFKRMVSQLIATAIANPIKLALGLSVTGAAGGAAVGAVSGGGGIGILGGLLGGGGILGGLSSGFGIGLSNLFTGGIGSYFAGIGAQFSTAMTGSLSAIGGLAGMLGPIAVGIGVLVKALSRKYAGTALRGTLGADGFDGTMFDFHKGGALRSDKEYYKDVPAEIQAILDTSMEGVRTSIHRMAGDLNLGSKAIDAFVSKEFTLWMNGKSEEEIREALNQRIKEAGDSMAELVLGTDQWSRAGETALDTLTRLSTGLNAVNDAADLLGHRMWDVSLASADAASELVDMFGGLEAMTAAVGTYWQAFYSEAERTETMLRRIEEQFAGLGMAMPQSRAAFRAVVEAVDTTTEAGRKLYAELIGLAGALDQVLPQVADFTLSMQGIIDQIGGEIGLQIDTARQMAADAKQSAQLWYRAANTIRDFLRDLTNSPLSVASPGQQFATNQRRFQTAFDLVKSGDADAAQDLPGLAKNYLESLKATAGSSIEYRRAAAQVMSALQLAAGISDVEGANDDVLLTLYTKQIDILTGLANFLKLDGIDAKLLKSFDKDTRKLIKDFDGTVGTYEKVLKQLGKAITDAKDFSYDKLLADMDVALKISDMSNLPGWVKTLVKKHGTGLRTSLDFVLRRNDLTPDLRWIATQSISSHVKNLKFLAKNNMGPRLTGLAVLTSSNLLKTLNFVVGSDLPPDMKRLALIGNSDLTRTVTAVLSSGIDKRAMKLALANVGAYDVAVRATLSRADLPDRVRQLVFVGQSEYAAIITATVQARNLDDAARRVLLRRQGRYAVSVIGTIGAETTPRIQTLLLRASTNAVRGITIAALFGDKMDPEKRALLLKKSTKAQRLIDAIVNPEGIDPLGAMFLDRLFEAPAIDRKIKAGVDASKVRDGFKSAYLNELFFGAGSVPRKIRAGVDTDGIGGFKSDYLDELFAGAGVIPRRIKGGVEFGSMSDRKTDYLTELLKGGGSVWRRIAGDVDLPVMPGRKGNYLAELFAGAGAVPRTIAGGVDLTLTGRDGDYLAQLFTGAGAVARMIAAGVDLDKLVGRGDKYLTELLKGGGSVWRRIAGGVSLDVKGRRSAYLSQLFAGSGSIPRTITGGVGLDVKGRRSAYLSQLFRGAGAVLRTITGGVDLVLSGREKEFLTQIASPAGKVEKIIKGSVDLKSLNARGRTLLDLVQGVNAGKVTVYGGFTFEPHEAFSTWFEGSLESGIERPMDTLTDALNNLRKEVRRQNRQTEMREIAAALDKASANYLTDASGAHVMRQSQLRDLAGIAGIDVAAHTAAGGTWQSLGNRIADLSAFDRLKEIRAVTDYGMGQALRARVTDPGLKVNAAGYMAAYPDAARSSMTAQVHFDRYGRAEMAAGRRGIRPGALDWTSIGLPAFATGGAHAGGWRVVGERGWELEHTAPSRVVSNSDARAMLDNRVLLAEVRALKAEMAAFRAESRAGDRAKISAAKRSADSLERIQLDGIPEQTP